MSRNSGKNKLHPFKAFALTFSSAELHTNRQINSNNLFLRLSTDLIVLLKYTIFCTIKDNDWKSLKIIESFKLCWGVFVHKSHGLKNCTNSKHDKYHFFCIFVSLHLWLIFNTCTHSQTDIWTKCTFYPHWGKGLHLIWRRQAKACVVIHECQIQA